jgi:hypothetical protein
MYTVKAGQNGAIIQQDTCKSRGEGSMWPMNYQKNMPTYTSFCRLSKSFEMSSASPAVSGSQNAYEDHEDNEEVG